MIKKSKQVIAACGLPLFVALNANAQVCNFEKSGNALTGTSYQAKVFLPPSTSKDAIVAIRAKLESSGQKIITIDVEQGTLQAEQPSKSASKALPITALLRTTNNETESVVTIRLNPLQLAPDEAVKAELCSYALAANQASQGATNQSDLKKSAVLTNSTPSTKPVQDANDNEFIKNGLPCLSGVCIGDDITQIKGINWLSQHPVIKKDFRQANAGEVNLLRGAFKAPDSTLQQIANSIVAGTFDSNGIASLTKVQASCDKLFVLNTIAHFKSQSGHLTQVLFQPTANSNTSEQVFRVTNINRAFEDAVTEKQKQDLSNALASSYKSVIETYKFAYSKQGEYPNVLINISNMRGKLELNLMEQTNVSLSRVDRLKQNPSCGGAKSVQIN
jgi:PI31 proteasome regulator N-terminal